MVYIISYKIDVKMMPLTRLLQNHIIIKSDYIQTQFRLPCRYEKRKRVKININI
jgi:uncharacterized protein YqgQ